MRNKFFEFCINEEGQDLVEYTLVLAMITLAAAAVLTKAGSSTNKIWSSASSTLSSAVLKAS